MIIGWRELLVDAPPFVFVLSIIFLFIGLMLAASLYDKKRLRAVVCIVLFAFALCSELICCFGFPSTVPNDGYDMVRDMAFLAELIFLPCAVGCLVGGILVNFIIKREANTLDKDV